MKTSKVNLDLELEILGQMFLSAEKKGIVLDVEPDEEQETITIVMHNVKFINGALRSTLPKTEEPKAEEPKAE